MFRNTVEEEEEEEGEEKEEEKEGKIELIHRALKIRVTYYTLNLLVAFSNLSKNYLLIKTLKVVVILQVMYI